jgi:sugar lactone lactonase YvrE
MRQISAGRLIALIAVSVAAAFAATAHGAGGRGTIDTIAGTGKPGLSGDGGPARKAKLTSPHGVAVDRKGNVYFVDITHNRVRKVDTRGKISTFAGTGKSGFSGDGGPARKAKLNSPWAVATDRSGNVYIADYLNRRVRKVNPQGTISTFAGNGEIANVMNPSSIGLEGPATDAALSAPSGVAVDGKGNVYVAGSWIVRRIDKHGILHAFAGTRLGFAGDGGPARQAQIGVTSQIAADKQGNVYITDFSVNRVRKIDTNGTISTFAGTGKHGFSGDRGAASKAKLYNPQGLAIDGKGNVYIGDDGNTRVRKVDGRGKIATIVGNGNRRCHIHGDGGPAKKACMDPLALAVNGRGDLLIADHGGNRIRIVYRVAAPVR